MKKKAAKKAAKKKTKKAKSKRHGRAARNDGNAFEQLIERIERALVPRGASVTRRDQIIDRDTGKPREIDLSIRFSVGSASVLIIVECRDRGRAADVCWVEQVSSKRRSVRADKAVLVSSKPLGRRALDKAAALDVDVRTCQQITEEAAIGWIRGLQAHVDYDHGSVTSITIGFDTTSPDGEPVALDPELEARMRAAAKVEAICEMPFLFDAAGKGTTPGDLLTQAHAGGWRAPQRKPDGEWGEADVHIEPKGLFVATTAGVRSVHWVNLGFVGFSGRDEIPLQRHRYGESCDESKEHQVLDGQYLTQDKRKRVSFTLVGPTASGDVRFDLREEPTGVPGPLPKTNVRYVALLPKPRGEGAEAAR